MPSESRVELAGADRQPVSNAELLGPAHPDERVEVTVLLRSRGGDELTAHVQSLAAEPSGSSPAQPMSREAFAAQFGADPDDIAKVEAFAREHDLVVVESSI